MSPLLVLISGSICSFLVRQEIILQWLSPKTHSTSPDTGVAVLRVLLHREPSVLSYIQRPVSIFGWGNSCNVLLQQNGGMAYVWIIWVLVLVAFIAPLLTCVRQRLGGDRQYLLALLCVFLAYLYLLMAWSSTGSLPNHSCQRSKTGSSTCWAGFISVLACAYHECGPAFSYALPVSFLGLWLWLFAELQGFHFPHSLHDVCGPKLSSIRLTCTTFRMQWLCPSPYSLSRIAAFSFRQRSRLEFSSSPGNHFGFTSGTYVTCHFLSGLLPPDVPYLKLAMLIPLTVVTVYIQFCLASALFTLHQGQHRRLNSLIRYFL